MDMQEYENRDPERGEETPTSFPLPPLTPPTKKRGSLFTMRLSWRGILLIIAIIIALRLWVVETVIVDGASMTSTLQPGEWALVFKPLSPERFSIVVFDDPEDQVPVIKRVIGMPGDAVGSVPVGPVDPNYLPRTRLQINGIVYNEPYARTTGGMIPSVSVPENYYYVLGDNRDDSIDSRMYGPVPGKDLRGVAVAVIYPLSHMRIISSTAEPAANQVADAGP